MSVENDLRQVLARLELVSHVSAVALDSSGGRDTSDDIGGNRPPGGVDRRDEKRDTQDDTYQLKSADHFKRRAVAARTDHALEEILKDAKRSLRAWTHQPRHDLKSEPEKGSPLWKHWCATTSMPVAEIAWKYNLSRQYVKRVIESYGKDAA